MRSSKHIRLSGRIIECRYCGRSQGFANALVAADLVKAFIFDHELCQPRMKAEPFLYGRQQD